MSLEVALHQMINALRSGPFANSLCKRPTTIMAELRHRAVIQDAVAKQSMSRRYNSKVKSRKFHPGDLV